MLPNELIALPQSFAGRTVVVTGAAGSMGRPLSFAFARAGANVVVNDFGGSVTGDGLGSNSVAKQLADEIEALGFSAVADSNSVTEGEKIIETAIRSFGQVDIIINNAGIISYGDFEQQTPATFRRLFEVNTLGPITTMLAAWPHFKKQKYGRIVNFASDSLFGIVNISPYVLTKTALFGVNKSLALEGGPHGITINCVGPSSWSRMLQTSMDDLSEEHQRFMKATYTGESNIPMVMALAHESNTINGETFSVGAWQVARSVPAVVAGPKDIRTMEQCFENQDAIMGKGQQVHLPNSVEEFLTIKASFL